MSLEYYVGRLTKGADERIAHCPCGFPSFVRVSARLRVLATTQGDLKTFSNLFVISYFDEILTTSAGLVFVRRDCASALF